VFGLSEFSVVAISGEIVDEGGAAEDGGVGGSGVDGVVLGGLGDVHFHDFEEAFVVGGKVEFLQNVMVAREVVAPNVGEEEIGKEGQDGDEEEAPDGDGIGPDEVKDLDNLRKDGGHGGEDPEEEEEEDDGAPHADVHHPHPPLREEGDFEDDGEEAADEGRHAQFPNVGIAARRHGGRGPPSEEGDEEDDERVVDGKDNPHEKVLVRKSAFACCDLPMRLREAFQHSLAHISLKHTD